MSWDAEHERGTPCEDDTGWRMARFQRGGRNARLDDADVFVPDLRVPGDELFQQQTTVVGV